MDIKNSYLTSSILSTILSSKPIPSTFINQLLEIYQNYYHKSITPHFINLYQNYYITLHIYNQLHPILFFKMQQINTPTLDTKSILASRRALSLFGPEDVCYSKITTRKNIISEENRVFKCNIIGENTFPESLCVLANKIIKKINIPNPTKSECTFFIRNIYSDEDIKLTICVPGTLQIVVFDNKLLQKPISNKATLTEAYVSSILRYMVSLLVPMRGYYYDPFQKGYPSFRQFLNKLIEFELTYKKKQEGISLTYQQMTKMIGNAFHVVAIFIHRMKMSAWITKYYQEFKQQIDSRPILVQFICQTISFGGDRTLLRELLMQKQVNPMWTYYLSLYSSKDQQIQVLKRLTYLNKTQIWLFLADIYINYHITNLTLVSKGLHILNILAEKKCTSIRHQNPYSKKLNLTQVQTLFAIQISMLPTVPIVYGIKSKMKTQSKGIEEDIQELRQLVIRYYNLSSLDRIIVKKLGFLIKQVGQQKTQLLFPKVFEQEFRNQDPLYYDMKPFSKRKQTFESQQQFGLPSFVKVQERNDKSQQNILSTATVSSSQESTKAQLWSIMQENTTPREQDHSFTQIEMVRFDPVEYCKKKYSSKQFIHLLELALDINQNLRRVLETLQIKVSQIGNLPNIKLPLQDLFILAEAAQINQMNKTCISFYNNIKSRVFDVYSSWKLIKVCGKINQFCTQLSTINQIIVDCQKYSSINLSTLPMWIQQHLFSTLKKKGTIFVEALLKSNGISQPAIAKSILKYTLLNPKQAPKSS